jgi:outer membrane protein TolC
MLKMKKLSLAIFMALHGLVAFAQTSPPQANEWEKKLFISEYALPLLIEAAIANAPELQNAEAMKQVAQEQRKIVQKNFYSNFSINSAYQYGSFANFGALGPDQKSNFNAFNLPVRSQYFAGLSLALPLGQLLSRHHQIKIQDLTISQAEGNKEIAERTIRQNVIVMYQNIVLAKAQLELQQEAYQTAVVSNELASKQFRNGSILIDAMSTVQQAYSTTAVALQSAKVNYETSILMMEEVIGTKIIDLIQSK